MAGTQTVHPAPDRHRPGGALLEMLAALSMTVGRTRAARAIADAADLCPQDLVLDIGCGPGAAVRLAARRAAAATGVDPSHTALRLARGISTLRRVPDARWLAGRAEALPVDDGSASVAWALHSLHHWDDQQAGLREIHRTLAPGGHVLLAERLLPRPGGRNAHGLTPDQAAELARQLAALGFADVRSENHRAGHQALIITRGQRAPDH